uniref:Uncharacterized protein n=1 Tax=Rhodopseudomonas palustris (strain DX-1) TaxID=652103 RepID=E6VMK6_RHOPX
MSVLLYREAAWMLLQSGVINPQLGNGALSQTT